MQTLHTAYQKLFHKSPANLKDWQLIQDLIFHLNPGILGEELSKWLCWFSVCCVNYPNIYIREQVIKRALDIAGELFEEYETRIYAEPHVSELEWIGNKRGYHIASFEEAA